MAQWVLKANGRVVAYCTLCPHKPEEEWSTTEQMKHDFFYELIERRWGIHQLSKGTNWIK